MIRTVRTITAPLLVFALVGSFAGCGGKTDAPAGDSGGSGTVTTITPDMLPITPGTSWTVAHFGGGGTTPIDLKVEGPWKITAGSSWRIDTEEIVDPKSVPGIKRFTGVTYVQKGLWEGATRYYPHRLTDEWVMLLGLIEVRGDAVDVQPYAEPAKSWPLGFTVGESYTVADTAESKVEAKVLAKSTADVPAGMIKDAYLLRFTQTSKTGKAPSTYYYIVAPQVGFVALIHAVAGNEASGFTSAHQVDVLATLPSKK
jgi:hypothetical protein